LITTFLASIKTLFIKIRVISVLFLDKERYGFLQFVIYIYVFT